MAKPTEHSNLLPLPSNALHIDDVLQKYGYGRYQVLCAVACGLLRATAISHLFLGTALVSNQNIYWKLSMFQDRLVYTVLAVFCTCGSVIGGKLSDIYGRRVLVLIGSLAVSIMILIGSMTSNYYFFILYVIAAGVILGINHSVSITLHGEVVPLGYRSLGTMNLNLVTYFTNMVICLVIYFGLFTSGWRYQFALLSIPNFVAFCMIFFIVDESPRFYGVVGNIEEQLFVLGHIKILNLGKSGMHFLGEENLRSTVVTSRGTWRGLIMQFFGATLTCCMIALSYSCVLTMITFATTLMVSCNYCSINTLLQHDTTSDKFEYLILTLTYLGLSVGSILTHNVISVTNAPSNSSSGRYTNRKKSLIILLALLLVTFVPQMYCINPYLLIVSMVTTLFALGGIYHLLSLVIIEIFPTYIRCTAVGITLSVAFLGNLFGPYVGFFINAGSLKSIYIMFYGGILVTIILVSRSITNTENLKLFETKEDHTHKSSIAE